jgi:hypothetical protein
VIEQLQRADGAAIVDLTYATGWLPHTTRAALTGLRKRGYAVIRERIGAGDSVYRISDASIHREDRTLPQRDAVDGREPSRRRHKRRTHSAGLSSHNRRKIGVVFVVHVLISHSFVNLRAIITQANPSDDMREINGVERNGLRTTASEEES